MITMQSTSTRSTGPLAAAPVSPLDFLDMLYQPGLLLPVSFDPAITDDSEYAKACEYGYDAYFEKMLIGTTVETFSWQAHFYSRQEVVEYVIENTTPTRNTALCGDTWKVSPLAWRVGFLVGWLSALALTDRELAYIGLEVLLSLVKVEQRNESRKARGRCVGGDGFPLDL